MMKVSIWRVGVLLTVVLACVAGLWEKAETQTLDPDQQLVLAHQLAETDRASDAIAILQTVSRTNPGTLFDARAQMQLAWTYFLLNDLPSTRQTWGRVAAQFPNTHFHYLAQTQLLDTQLLADGIPFTQYLTGLESLIAQAGGPDLQELRSGRRVPIRPVSGMNVPTQRYVLCGLYMTAAGRIARRPPPEAGLRLTLEAINLWVYTRDTFPDFAGAEATRDLRDEVLNLTGQLQAVASYPPDRTPPKITKTKPDTSCGPESDIRASITDGDITQSQVDLTTLQLTVDGVDSSSQAQVFSTTSRNARLGHIFQNTKVRLRPIQPWTSGIHHVDLKVSDMAANPAHATWSFSVSAGGRDDRDDHSGDARTDGEPVDN